MLDYLVEFPDEEYENEEYDVCWYDGEYEHITVEEAERLRKKFAS
jgi:hypothetical protein